MESDNKDLRHELNTIKTKCIALETENNDIKRRLDETKTKLNKLDKDYSFVVKEKDLAVNDLRYVAKLV